MTRKGWWTLSTSRRRFQCLKRKWRVHYGGLCKTCQDALTLRKVTAALHGDTDEYSIYSHQWVAPEVGLYVVEIRGVIDPYILQNSEVMVDRSGRGIILSHVVRCRPGDLIEAGGIVRYGNIPRVWVQEYKVL